MFVLHVPNRFNRGTAGSHRSNSGYVERLEKESCELPILHLHVIKVEPQGGAGRLVDVHDPLAVTIAVRFGWYFARTDDINIAPLPFPPGRFRPSQGHVVAL